MIFSKRIRYQMKSTADHPAVEEQVINEIQDYMLFFKSTKYQNEDSDKEQTIINQLDALYEEVKTFEEEVLRQWQDKN